MNSNPTRTKPTKVSLSLSNWLTVVAIVVSQGLATIGFVLSREVKMAQLDLRVQVTESQVVQSVTSLKEHVDARMNYQQAEISDIKKMVAVLVEREMNRPRNVLAKE